MGAQEPSAVTPLAGSLDRARWDWPMGGREADLEALRRELSILEHPRRFAVICGEPGIGKTRLVSEFATEAHASGAAVLAGRASEQLEKPYLPFIEAFGEYLDATPPEKLADADGHLAELTRLVPEAASRLGRSTARKDSPASEQFSLFKAALSLLRLASREAPLVLVLEDLHWADEATLLMLQYLLTGRGEFRGLIVGTLRPGVRDAGPLGRALAQLGREPGFARVDLRSLSDHEMLSVLTGLAGSGLKGHSLELAAELRRETGGNPLYATELIRSALDSGDLAEIEGGWRLREDLGAVPLPATLAEAIGQRLSQMGEGEMDAFRVAAVAGEEFDPTLVESALGREPGAFAATWRSAERSGLVMPLKHGPLAFRHSIVRRALLEDLGREQRASLERRLEQAVDAGGQPHRIAAARLEHRGDHWAISIAEREMTLKDAKGVGYLARLLDSPGVEIHAVDLQGGAALSRHTQPGIRAAGAELALQPIGGGDAGPALDETAKRRYRARIEELETEIEEAEGFNDPERAANAREELEFIGKELAAAVGIGGRDRLAASEAERARVNVTRAIRGTLNRIEEQDNALGRQLKAAVKTGAFCSFDPVPGQSVRWEVTAKH